MAHTYTAGGGAKDDIRLLIGDIDSDAPEDLRLENDDITRLLELHGSTKYAAAAAARVLAAKFARKHEGSSGGPGPSRTRAQDLMALATRIESGALGSAVPTAGGLRHSQKEDAASDPDLVAPTFHRGMLDHPESD